MDLGVAGIMGTGVCISFGCVCQTKLTTPVAFSVHVKLSVSHGKDIRAGRMLEPSVK